MKLAASFVSVLLFCVHILIASAADLNSQGFMAYWEKGNSGQKLGYGEFKTLVAEVEKCMIAFRERFSKISIEQANMSYSAGKTWEISHKVACEQFDDAFKFLENVKKYPNHIIPSYYLYVLLNMFIETSADFANIDSFRHQMGDTHIALNMWTKAFQKAHLNRLAEAKDKGIELYLIK